MIRFDLKCNNGHHFESWFQNSAAYDSLAQAGMIECGVCGSSEVEKSLMAPKIGKSSKSDLQPDDMHRKIAELRKTVESNSEYVGVQFAAEARKIHEGDAPERNIYGEAKPEEALKLLKDGIAVTPLPFMPRKQTH